jgi:hypothetical protein
LTQDQAEQPGGIHIDVVWSDIARRPYEYLVRRWNWKAGLTSAILRGAIFFSVNLTAGRDAAVGAMLTEFAYRILFSGFVGSVTEAFRKCEPAWAAAVTVSVVLPLISHVVEFTVHYLRGTPRVAAGVDASILFSIFSTLFNLYIMRRGVLVVGTERKPLLEDLAALPRLLIGFLIAAPLKVWKIVASGDSPSRK